MNLVSIHSIDDPRIQAFAAQRDVWARMNGEIVVDSGRVVTRLLKQNILIKAIFASPEYYAASIDLVASHPQTTCYVAPHSLLEQVIGHRLHQGVMALAERPADIAQSQLGPRIVALNGVNNAENVGAILRSAHAFGIEGILVDSGSCSPWVRRAIRVSMGSVFKLNIHHTDNLAGTLSLFIEDGYSVWATGETGPAPRPQDVPWGERAVLVLGCEDSGVAHEIQALATGHVRIPIAVGIDSLNASVAAGILLHAMGSHPI